MPFLTQGKTNWKYILIVVILAIIVGGGILGWIKMQEIPPVEFPKIKRPIKAPEIEVDISPDLKSLQVKKEEKLAQTYTIEQWQEWAEKNWNTLGLTPFVMDELGVIGDEPDDFIQFISVSLSSDKNKIAFAISSREIALVTFSIKGILILETGEVNIIPNVFAGDVEKFIWSPTGKYFAYTIGTARAEWDVLGVDDVSNRKNNFMLGGKEIGLILGEPSPAHFVPQFRNLEWSSDEEKLYFKTNDKGSQGEVEWVINTNGTDLRKVIEDKTANWKTYRNEEYRFEFKYPAVFDKFEYCKITEEDNFIGLGSRFSILISDAEGLNLSEYVAREKEELLREQEWPLPGESWSQKDIHIGDAEGIRVMYAHGPRYSEMIYLLKDNKIFNIGYTAGISCLSYYAEKGLIDENGVYYDAEIFEQIPYTFKFLE